MAAKKGGKTPAQPVQQVRKSQQKNYVKIPKFVGVMGMTDRVWRRMMIVAIREQAGRKKFNPLIDGKDSKDHG